MLHIEITETVIVSAREIGCDVVQGFCVSRPVPAAEFAELLAPGRQALAVGGPTLVR
jgi:EAL domain-containing protein (putative c-di-GMP-specific phosphodiesterase class I)